MTKKNKKLIIKSRSEMPLILKESVDSTPDKPKYIFQGVFTECSTPDHVVINRNQRSYPLKEVASHIAYLRDQIKESGFILGELDHPADGRFDTSLKQASHAILDIWIDFDRAVVEGKLQLLDTPNGKIAQTLVEAGYPLYVSSRAAGSVGNDKNHTVKIDQLFSYDIVCVPGFANARLQRIDESVATKDEIEMQQKVAKHLDESASQYKIATENAEKYGINDGMTFICESEGSIPEMSEKKKSYLNGNFDMDSLSKPVHEGEDVEFKLPETSTDPNKSVVESDEDENKDENTDSKEEKTEMTDAEKAEKRKLIVSVDAIPVDGNGMTDAEKAEKRAEILDIETVEATEDDNKTDEEKKADDALDDITDDEDDAKEDLNINVASGNSAASGNQTASGNDVASGNQDSGNGSGNGNTAAPQTTLDMPMPIPASAEPKSDKDDIENPTDIKQKDKDNKNIKDKVLNDKEVAQDVKQECEEQKDKVAELLKKVKKVAEVKESIVKHYPFSAMLTDDNFGAFAALKPAQKNKVQRYILEHNIYNPEIVNQQWKTPLIEEKRQLKNWMRLASEEDRMLFAAAPIEVQDAIEESAKYVIIQTQEDCDRFWEKTGLRQ